MGEASDEMDRVLEALGRGGRHESAGFFTIDVMKALPKLSRHQLPMPSFYLLKWVQWAVAARAQNIRVKTGSGKVSLEHDGAAPSVEQMQDLLQFVFRSQREPLHHLAVGMATALTLAPRAVLECWDGQVGHRWIVEPGGVRLDGAPRPREKPFCRLTLPRQPDVEEQLLRNFCPFCPAALTINSSRVDRQLFGAPERPWLFRNVLEKVLPDSEALGRLYRQAMRMPASFSAGEELKSKLPWWFLIFHIEEYVLGSVHRHHHLLEAQLVRNLPTDRVGVPPDSRASLRCHIGMEERGADCWALIAVETSLEEQARVAFVRDGVLIPAQAPPLPLPGLVMAISSYGLTTDASEFALVEDDALRTVWETLQERLSELAEKLLKACEDKQIPLDWYVQPRLQSHYRENRLRRERGRYFGT